MQLELPLSDSAPALRRRPAALAFDTLPLWAYDRPANCGDDLNGPLSPDERRALAHHGLAVTPRPDGRYDVAGDRWPRTAWELRQEIDLFYLAARWRHPLEGVL